MAEKMTARITIYTTPEEKWMIREAARLSGISMSEFIRRALKDYIGLHT